VSNTAAGNTVRVGLVGPDGTQFADLPTTRQSDDGAWRFTLTPNASWPSGVITARVINVGGQVGNFGEGQFFHNLLGATISPTPGSYAPGDPIPVTGRLFELWNEPSVLIAPPSETDVAGTFNLRVVWPDGSVRGPYGPFTASAGGTAGAISATIPAAATTGITADETTNFKAAVSIAVIDAAYNDNTPYVTSGGIPSTLGQWAATRAGAGAVTLSVPPNKLLLENSFVSAVGWVKPGATYPFRVFVRNYTASAELGALVTIPAPDGTTFTNATAVNGSGSCVVNGGGGINWNIGAVAAAGPGGPTIKTCVVEAKADSTAQEPQIVWKNLSSTATLTYT
ncbi:MAG: hypothetical protein ACRDPR_01425, partial [Nocardioidaceae bacterium]